MTEALPGLEDLVVGGGRVARLGNLGGLGLLLGRRNGVQPVSRVIVGHRLLSECDRSCDFRRCGRGRSCRLRRRSLGSYAHSSNFSYWFVCVSWDACVGVCGEKEKEKEKEEEEKNCSAGAFPNIRNADVARAKSSL